MTVTPYLTIPLRTEEQARADRAKRCADIIAAWDMDEVATILNALSAADEQDFDYLASRLGDGGRDRFWKAVISYLRPVFSEPASGSNIITDGKR
jgi:hypothetical protein